MLDYTKYHAGRETFIKVGGIKTKVEILIEKDAFDDLHQLFHVVWYCEIRNKKNPEWQLQCSGFGIEGPALDPIIPGIRTQLKRYALDMIGRGYEVRNLTIAAGSTAGSVTR